MLLYKCFLTILLLCLTDTTAALVLPNPNTNPEQLGQKYQGDMIMQPETNAKGVAARPTTGTPWPNGVIPYEFAPNITANHTALIVGSMREMENLTSVNGTQCIRFRPKNASDTIFITIFNGSGCYAPVGSWGSYPSIRPVSFLDSPYATCMISGIIQHELTHVLGFFHEQSRPDRDTYVSIQWNNIDPSSTVNFEKYNDTDVDTLSTAYDYGSVMHYGPYDFAMNMSSPTIVPLLNNSANIGQRVRLSPTDILEIQRYYGCLPTPTTTTSTSSTTTTTTTTSTSTTSVTTSTTSRTTTSRTTSTSSSTSSSSTTSITTSTTTTSRMRNARSSGATVFLSNIIALFSSFFSIKIIFVRLDILFNNQ